MLGLRQNVVAPVLLAVACHAALAQNRLPTDRVEARRPRGVYAVVNLTEVINQELKANPSADLNAYLTGYYTSLLNNPAIAGLTLQVHWDMLNPRAPSDPQPYDWSTVDDAFQSAAAWNSRNPAKPWKTVQLIVNAGFQSPQWLLTQIPSCDGLFQTPPQTPANNCGKATFTGFIESGDSTELPLPWNPVYKSAWKTFLTSLAAQYGSNPAFVSIAIAGPTAASAEMLLPHNGNTPAQSQFGGISPNQMWLDLLTFAYPGKPQYQKSDQAIIDEWNAAIDLFGSTFTRVTLVATTGNGLPNFAGGNFTIPSAFTADCTKTADMDCAAEATILSHFADPAVGGQNAKATQESGMEGSRIGLDLGIDGVKWLSQSTARLGRKQVLGGSQFNTSFANFSAQEGCPSVFPPNAGDAPAACNIPPACTVQACIPVNCIPQACLAPGFTTADLTSFKTFGNVPAADLISPEQAAYNVLKIFFTGTAAAPAFGGTAGTAPLNYLQIYGPDILYATAHAGSPVPVIQASGATAVMSAQDLLNLASQKLMQLSEPMLESEQRIHGRAAKKP